MNNFRIKPNDACVIIEGLNWTQQSYVLSWMSAAASLDSIRGSYAWSQEHDDLFCQLSFSSAAIGLVSTFANRLAIVSMQWSLACELALLAKLGFFTLQRDMYRFSIPKSLPNADRIIDVVLQLGGTYGRDGYQPEKMVDTIPFRRALKGPWTPQRCPSDHALFCFLEPSKRRPLS
jgi:hypothetical protein